MVPVSRALTIPTSRFSRAPFGADGMGTVQDIRVLLVDESPGLTQGLLLALPRRGPVRVLGPVLDVGDVVVALEQLPADIVVVDIDRDDGRGLEVLAAVSD